MSVTIKTSLDATGVRAGLQALASEGRTFRDTFRKNIESGGGLFGSIDSALGKLAGGRFAAPIAAMGAALGVLNGQVARLNQYWDNFGKATERAQQNLEAVRALQADIAGQRFAGDRANTEAGRRAAAATAESQDRLREAGQIKDPSTLSGAYANAVQDSGREGFFARSADLVTLLSGASFARSALNKVGVMGPSNNALFNAGATVLGSAGVPGAAGYFEAQNDLYNQRQGAADAARQAEQRESAMRPYVEFANRTDQRSGQAALIAAEDRLGMSQGRTTGFEAAANKLLFASAQYQDALRTYKNEDDPRVQSARASALEAFTVYDAELSTARRYRNDPTIAADSLARLGGGGNVNVFGDGRGELLFEQKRLNQSTIGLTKVIEQLNVTLSKGFGEGLN